MFSKLSLCKHVVDLEFPIHRLMASGSFPRAIRAKGMSFRASGYNGRYSSRRLSFSLTQISKDSKYQYVVVVGREIKKKKESVSHEFGHISLQSREETPGPSPAG